MATPASARPPTARSIPTAWPAACPASPISAGRCWWPPWATPTASPRPPPSSGSPASPPGRPRRATPTAKARPCARPGPGGSGPARPVVQHRPAPRPPTRRGVLHPDGRARRPPPKSRLRGRRPPPAPITEARGEGPSPSARGTCIRSDASPRRRTRRPSPPPHESRRGTPNQAPGNNPDREQLPSLDNQSRIGSQTCSFRRGGSWDGRSGTAPFGGQAIPETACATRTASSADVSRHQRSETVSGCPSEPSDSAESPTRSGSARRRPSSRLCPLIVSTARCYGRSCWRRVWGRSAVVRP